MRSMLGAIAGTTLMLASSHVQAFTEDWHYLEGVESFSYAEDYAGDPQCRPPQDFTVNILTNTFAQHQRFPKHVKDGDAVIAVSATFAYIPEISACSGSVGISVSRTASTKFIGAKSGDAKIGPVVVYNDATIIFDVMSEYQSRYSWVVSAHASKLWALWGKNNHIQ